MENTNKDKPPTVNDNTQKKDNKNIQNTSDGINWGTAIAGAPELLRSAWQSGRYEQTAGDLTRFAGQTYGSVGGVGYLRNNNLDTSAIHKEFRANTGANILGTAAAGAGIGATFGPIGAGIGAVGGALIGGIGSIIRGNSMDRKIAEANDNIFRTNTVNEAIAQSQAMNYNWNQSFLDTYNQVRAGAKYGLDSRESSVNAVMKPEEMIIDGNGNGNIPGGGIPGKDSVPVHVEDDTAILNDYFTAKALPSLMKQKYLKQLVDKNKGESKNIAQRVVQKHLNESKEELLAVADEQKAARDAGLIPKGDNDMPIHAYAGWDSVGVNTLSGLIGAGQFISAYGSKVKDPNTYRINPYAVQAFDQLDRINIPMLPITNQLKDDRAKGIQQITNSGGLSSSQKLAGYAATTSNHQSNTAKALFSYYNQLNDIKAKTAQLKLGEGQHAAQMMQNAAQWDLDYYSKAHAARQDMMNMGIYNTVNSLRQLVADADKRKRFDKMYELYYQEHPESEATEKIKGIDKLRSQKGVSVERPEVPKFSAKLRIPTIPIGSSIDQIVDAIYNKRFGSL